MLIDVTGFNLCLKSPRAIMNNTLLLYTRMNNARISRYLLTGFCVSRTRQTHQCLSLTEDTKCLSLRFDVVEGKKKCPLERKLIRARKHCNFDRNGRRKSISVLWRTKVNYDRWKEKKTYTEAMWTMSWNPGCVFLWFFPRSPNLRATYRTPIISISTPISRIPQGGMQKKHSTRTDMHS